MIRLFTGDSLAVLKTLPDESVHCVVTSPPYWGLRDYGIDGQMGLEKTLGAHIERVVQVFREVNRVLRQDGTLWLNYGDSYAAQPNGRAAKDIVNDDRTFRDKPFSTIGPVYPPYGHDPFCKDKPRRGGGGNKGYITSDGLPRNGMPGVLKPKDLCGIPWRVAFALQADGWYLRQDIIWSKLNPMPESVTDRCTKAHEYIFLLSKSARYYYDADAIAEPLQASTLERGKNGGGPKEKSNNDPLVRQGKGWWDNAYVPSSRNKRSVWEIATAPFSEAHFATFPPALIEPCILAGCPEKCCAKCSAPWVREIERSAMVIDRSERTHDLGRTRSSGTMLEPPKSKTLRFSPSCSCNADAVPGTCLDPFGGAGTTGLVADRLGRNAILIELNPAYVDIAQRRLKQDAGMFNTVTVA